VSDSEHTPEDAFDFSLDVTVLVGHWANSTRVYRGRDEFTIDFVRHVPAPVHRVLVARALLSPLLSVELRDQLDEAWREYSEWSMPEDRR